MLNYQIAPGLLKTFLPAGTELDVWEGKTFVSVVGFLFLKTRVWGMPIPFHRNFEEVNLRFYVRRKSSGGWRRGVVFIKEIVPRAAIAWTARTFYNENYLALPMWHQIKATQETVKSATYSWNLAGHENSISVEVRGPAQSLRAGTEAEFITEHYWGYARQRDGSTLEYQVEHPPWRVQECEPANLNCAIADLYGPEFVETMNRPPASAFLAEGSPVLVRKGVRLP